MLRTISRPAILFILLLFAFNLYSSSDCRLFIVTSEALDSSIESLVQWKTQLGWAPEVIIVPADVNRNIIKNAILDRIDSLGYNPEYLLLVGNDDVLRYSYAYDAGTDTEYGELDGIIGSEIFTGRLPVANSTQLANYVTKLKNYQQNPTDAVDSLWYTRGSLVVNLDHSANDSIYWNTLHHVAALMDSVGWTTIDTMSTDYYNGSDIRNRLHDGRGFLIYRGQGVEGWYGCYGLNPSSLENEQMPTIVSGTTCATINTFGPSWINNAYGGAILYLGTLTVSGGGVLSQQRSAMALGFADGLFTGMYSGESAERGREYVLEIDDYATTREYASCVLLGDPTLQMWTQQPESLLVEHPIIYTYGESSLDFIVRDRFDNPIANATVCIILDTIVYEYGFTDSYGALTLPTEYFGSAMDSMLITVTAWNHFIYTKKIGGMSDSYLPVITNFNFNDTLSGNGDGKLSRGEKVNLSFQIINLGALATGPLSVRLFADNPEISIDDTTIYPSTLVFLDSDTIPAPFELYITESAEYMARYGISFQIIARTDTFMYSTTLPPIIAANPVTDSVIVSDDASGGDGVLTWGESILLQLGILDDGTAAMKDITVRFTMPDYCFIWP